MQHMLHQTKAQQIYTDLDLYQQCYVLQKIEEFKDFSRHLSDFPVLFKAYLNFKDFSRKPSKFKYFSSLCKPWNNYWLYIKTLGLWFPYLALSNHYKMGFNKRKLVFGVCNQVRLKPACSATETS